MIVCGFCLRLSGISRLGFAEDEINKLDAVLSYERGDIRPNAEHPMLMKALMFVSYEAAKAWNSYRPEHRISDEAAIRFPNILFGALTVIPIYLLTVAFFDRRTALIACAMWAVGINAITYNRIAKEDTLLVFFMLFAFYFYLRAKQISGNENKKKLKYFSLSGIFFGLMLASKYFPHYFGLNALFHHVYKVRETEPGEPSWRAPRRYYVLTLVVFLLANPAILLPQTWIYLQSYTSGNLLKHTGYLMGETLYKNNMPSTPFWGTPLYFYLLYLAIKVPLPIIISFVVGLIISVKNWRTPAYGFLLLMFVMWIVPYSLIGAKWLRFTLSLMPIVYMIAAVGVVALLKWIGSFLKDRSLEKASVFAQAAVLLFFIAVPAWTAYANRPHYALYTNNVVSETASGFYFPHDEFYDDGLREAIKFICDTAPHGAMIVNETPGVVRFYLQVYGRADLQPRVLSDPTFNVNPQQETFIILQRGRTYFENKEKMDKVRSSFRLAYASCPLLARPSAEVYATGTGPALVKMCDNINL